MNLIVIGINHKTASVKVREQFSFTARRLDESLVRIKNSSLVLGTVILSTCNRTEVYLNMPDELEQINLERLNSLIFNIYNST